MILFLTNTYSYALAHLQLISNDLTNFFSGLTNSLMDSSASPYIKRGLEREKEIKEQGGGEKMREKVK